MTENQVNGFVLLYALLCGIMLGIVYAAYHWHGLAIFHG